VQSRASRVARGFIAGSFATGVAALGHGLADGMAPSVLAIATGVVFAGLLGTFAAGRTPSLPRLALTVGGAQLAFHLVFSWLTPGTGMPGAHHTAGTLLAPAVEHHGTEPVMWLAHALAGIATLVFLARAERALWSLLAEAVEAATVARTPAIASLPRVPHPVPGDAVRHPVAFSFLSQVTHRGPPSAPASV
jgi:hypothetical protein